MKWLYESKSESQNEIFEFSDNFGPDSAYSNLFGFKYFLTPLWSQEFSHFLFYNFI